MRGGGHCSTNGLVNEPAECWQGVALRCLVAPDNKAHIFDAQNNVRQGCKQSKGSAVCCSSWPDVQISCTNEMC